MQSVLAAEGIAHPLFHAVKLLEGDSAARHRIHHVERDDNGQISFEHLRRQIQIAFEIGRVR